jgi:3-hydroxyacyl-CoA dehydrogenase
MSAEASTQIDIRSRHLAHAQMGQGIAAAFARAGFPTAIVDLCCPVVEFGIGVVWQNLPQRDLQSNLAMRSGLDTRRGRRDLRPRAAS